jgi:retinol-binding protein 3
MPEKVFVVYLYMFSCLSPLFSSAQNALTSEIKKQTIDTLCQRLNERYAFKDVAAALSQLLQANLKNKKYDKLQTPEDFSRVITNDLRSKNADKHLALNYDLQSSALVSNNQNSIQETADERAKRVSSFNRQMNYGFNKTEFFPGNIGYIKFDYFDSYLDYSGPVIDASFGFLKNSDAIIIDLRGNSGGASSTVGYIAGFFFDSTTLVGASYNRYTDSTTSEYLEPQEKSKRLSNADLYILTSNTTISAGEALAYILKYMKNAKVIGETSAGAANPGRVTRVNKYFTAFIPNRHGINIISKTNWEGTGVPVDIKVPANEALTTAKIEALKKLKNNATDSFKIRKLDQYLKYQEALTKKSIITPETAREYIGKYQDEREISFRTGKLYYKGSAQAGGEMIPVKKYFFMTEEGNTTISFVRDNRKKIISLVYTWVLSPNPSTSKKIK